MADVLLAIPRGLLLLLSWEYWVAWGAVCLVALVAARAGLMVPVLCFGADLHAAACVPRVLEDPSDAFAWARAFQIVQDHPFWLSGVVALQVAWIKLMGRGPTTSDGQPILDASELYRHQDAQRSLIRLALLLGAAFVASWLAPSGCYSRAHSAAWWYGIPACAIMWLLSRVVGFVVTLPLFNMALKKGMNHISARDFVEGPLFWPVTLFPLYSYLQWIASKQSA